MGIVNRLLLLVAALATPAAASAQAKAPLVLAAASLQESMIAAAAAWARQGHVKPVVSFAASSALARQVEAGGAADLFVSADEEWIGLSGDAAPDRPCHPRDVPRQSAGRGRPQGEQDADPRPATVCARQDPGGRTAGNGGRLVGARGQVRQGGAAEARRVECGRAQGRGRRERPRGAGASSSVGRRHWASSMRTDAKASPSVRIAGVFPESAHPPITYPVARAEGVDERGC